MEVGLAVSICRLGKCEPAVLFSLTQSLVHEIALATRDNPLEPFCLCIHVFCKAIAFVKLGRVTIN